MRPEAHEHTTIIVGIDGTERGEDALALARAVASRDAHIVLAAIPHWQPEQAALWLSQAAATQPGIALETRLVEAATPARGLRDLADATRAELIVVGSTHRGWLGRILPGSVGEHLLHDAPCPVAIAPRGFALGQQDQLGTLAVAYDASPESEAAVRFAAARAQAADAPLRILTTAETNLAGHPGPIVAGAYLDIARSKHDRLQNAMDHLGQLLELLPPGLQVETCLLDGDPSRRLLEETEGDIDLLVLGSRGYGAAARVLTGSVLSTVIRSASCAVVTVPRPDATADEELTRSGATAA